MMDIEQARREATIAAEDGFDAQNTVAIYEAALLERGFRVLPVEATGRTNMPGQNSNENNASDEAFGTKSAIETEWVSSALPERAFTVPAAHVKYLKQALHREIRAREREQDDATLAENVGDMADASAAIVVMRGMLAQLG